MKPDFVLQMSMSVQILHLTIVIPMQLAITPMVTIVVNVLWDLKVMESIVEVGFSFVSTVV